VRKTPHPRDGGRRLRLKKDTLRTLSTDEAAQVRGGVFLPPKKVFPHCPNESRYCLAYEEP